MRPTTTTSLLTVRARTTGRRHAAAATLGHADRHRLSCAPIITYGEGGTISRRNARQQSARARGSLRRSFLGLTTGCAVCHDHKFDPTTQKDFYQLTAFFNNLTENPANDDRNDWPPFIRVPKPENREGLRSVLLAERVGTYESRSRIAQRGAQILVAAWLRDNGYAAAASQPRRLAVRLRFDEQKGQTLRNSRPELRLARSLPPGARCFGAKKSGPGPLCAWIPVPGIDLPKPEILT